MINFFKACVFLMILYCPLGVSAAFDCNDAVELTCGDNLWFGPLGTSDFGSAQYDASACGRSISWSFDGGDTLFYFDVGTGPTDVTIELTGLLDDLDMIIFKQCSATSLSNCVGNSMYGSNSPETIVVTNASGKYYVIVDSYSSTISSPFDIKMRCSSPSTPTPATGCDAAISISCGESKFMTASSVNNFYGNHYDLLSCGNWGVNYDGNDHLFKLEVGSQKRDLEVNLTGLSSDLDLMIFRYCHDYGTVKLDQCEGASFRSFNNSETVSIPGASGTYYIVVDAYDFLGSSNYTIAVTCGTPSSPSSSCYSATPLSCGQSTWVSAPTSNNYSGSDYNFSGCLGSNPGYSGKDRLYRIDIGSSPKDILIELTGLSADLDMFLFRSCWGSSLSSCVAYSNNGWSTDESIGVSNASGVYYLSVDSNSPWVNSGYEISLTCQTVYPSFDCSDATPLNCGDNKWVSQPTTNHFEKNDYQFSGCMSSSYDFKGKDHLYEINIGSSPKDISIKMSGLSADLDMFLFRSCENHYGNNVLSSCIEKSINSGNASETITLSGATGTYYLAIDNEYSWTNSGYEISLDCYGAPASYDCSAATPLACGSNNWVSAPTVDHFGSSDILSDCSGGSFSHSGKDHLYEISVGSTPVKLKIDLTGLTADMDMFLYKSCSNHYGADKLSNCVDKSINSSSNNESIIIDNATGSYYLLVEGYNSWATSGYEISVDCSSYAPSFDCSDAIPLNCGDNKWVSQPTTNHFEKNDYQFSGCMSSSYDFKGKDHLYEINIGSSPKDISIKMSGLSADLDMFLFRSCENHYGNNVLSSCIEKSINSGNASETITLSGATGTYYLAIDNEYSWTNSGYEISLDCYGAPTSYDCSDATPLACGSNNWVSAPTVDHFGSSNILSDCSGGSFSHSGKDHLYEINVGSTPVKLKIDLTGLTADMDMFLYKSCSNHYGADKLSNCVDKSINSSSNNESIIIDNASGSYYLLVEGYNSWATSGYEISVDCSSYAPSFDCSDAITLSCGQNKWSSQPTVNHFSGTNYDFSDCGISGSSYSGMDHLYRVIAGNNPVDLKIKLDGLTKDMDMFLFRSCQDHYGNNELTECIEVSKNSGISDEEIIVPGASGVYYLVVDGKNAWSKSSYEISVTCDPVQQVCTGAVEIECGELIIASNSSSDSRSSDRINSHNICDYGSGYTGREVVFVLKGHYSGIHNVTVDLHTFSSNVDLDLIAYSSCQSSYNSNINDWNYAMSNGLKCSQNSRNKTESLFFNYIAPHEEIYLVVDAHESSSYGSAISQFELSVSCGDICDQTSTNIDCGETLSGTTVSASNGASYYSCDTEGNNWGPEKTYKLYIEETTDVTIDLEVSSGADLNMYLVKSCSPLTCQAMSNNRGSGVDESISKTLNPGTFYIVIDGYQGDEGSFDLSIYGCGGCNNATEIWCDSPVHGTTINATNSLEEVKDDCFALSSYPVQLDGGDEAFLFVAPSSQEYTFSLTGHSKNVDLYLMDDCESRDACRGYSTKIDTHDESVTIYLEKDQEIYAVVDSRYTSQESDFYIAVSCTVEPDPQECFDISIVATGIGENVLIDLRSLIKDLCSNNQILSAYETNDSGDVIDGSSIEILIQDDSTAVFVPTVDHVSHSYLICYEVLCEDSPFICCIPYSTDPILSCGDTYSGSTFGGVSSFGKADISDCYSSSSSFNGPDELIKFTKGDSNDILQLTLYHESSNLSLFVFDEEMKPVNMSCKGRNFNSSKMYGNSGTVGESYSDKDNLLDAGTYYALIEGYASSIMADFVLSISCGMNCSDYEDIGCGDVIEDVTNTSIESSNSIYHIGSDTVLVAYTGGEKVYRMEIDYTSERTISINNIVSEGELDLFVLSDICDASQVVASSLQTGTTEDVISMTFDSGSYFIVIDGWNRASGTFDLSISDCPDPDAIAQEQVELRSKVDVISESIEELAVDAYPNPFSDEITLRITSPNVNDANMNFYSPEGKLLLKTVAKLKKGTNTILIDADSFKYYRGMIYYIIDTPNSQIQGKAIRIK